MSRSAAPARVPVETPEQALCRRAYGARRRGDDRRAMLLLREAAHRSDRDPKLWTLYGAHCARMGRRAAAEEALTQAAWLRERRGEAEKARVTRGLLSRAATRAA